MKFTFRPKNKYFTYLQLKLARFGCFCYKKIKTKTMKFMKTKISHLLALLTLTVAAVLIENAFLQSMSINRQAYDLIARTTINEISRQDFNLIKAAGRVALADASVPLFPGATRLTFSDDGLVRYRIDAPLNTVARFYNQVMSSV